MTQIWLWVDFVVFSLAALNFGIKVGAMRRQEGLEFPLISFFVVLWSAALYLTMIFHQTVTPFHGHEVYWGRYIDWLVATPLLLLNLNMVAGLRPKLIAGVMGADIFMILGGLVGNFSTKPVNFIWYIISCGAFIAIIAAILTEFSSSAAKRHSKVKNLFNRLKLLLIVAWTGYPLTWIIGPEGLDLISPGWESFCYTVVDILSKVGFAFLLTKDKQALTQASKSMMETVQSYIQSNEKGSNYT